MQRPAGKYLTLTQQIIEERGALIKIGPPMRSSADQAALRQGLPDGNLNGVASDHAPKGKDPNGDFLVHGYGSPQIKTLLPVTDD